jgi:ubiquinone/menaquinone biosynthesis C-methylase UbiE
MVEANLKTFGKYYDQIYLQMKDYENESEALKSIIKRFERKPSKTLLDVGCGTAEHLKYLCQSFQCRGIDIDEQMIKAAQSKVPSAQFTVANMIDFRLEAKFDVITCLFSSIGYVQDFENLEKALRNFNNHLSRDGIVIIEPWVFKKDFKKGHISIDTYKDDTIKLARMATSKLMRLHWLVYMHYLIGSEGAIKYVKETHKMLAADCEDYVRAFNLAGFGETRFLTENLWKQSRGLFVAAK